MELYNNAPGNRFLVGEPGYASSVFVTASPGDKKARFTLTRNVPWINSRYDLFRYNQTTTKWDSVGSTNVLAFTDPGLINGNEYCYYVRSTGAYSTPGLAKNLVNFSESVCVTPFDNEAPCTPGINVTSQCDSLYNTVRWSVTDKACLDDITGYKIYYKMKSEEALALLTTITDKNIFAYRHYPGDIISGCYAVSSFDAIGWLLLRLGC